MPRINALPARAPEHDFAYQEVGIDWLRPRDHAFLGDEAGLGKSRQLIMAAEPPVLIVAPAMVLDGGVWDTEVRKWRPDLDPERDVVQRSYHGLVQKLPGAGAKGGTVFTKRADPELLRQWGTVIYDEAHYLKGRETTWVQAGYEINREADRVYLASGTPIPNWPHELFVPLTMLFPDDAKRGGRLGSYWRWAAEWFIVGPKFTKSGRMVSQYNVDGDLKACGPSCIQRPANDPCEHWHAFYRGNFGDRFLQRLRDDVLDQLPPLVVQDLEVHMGREQKKFYSDMKEQFVAWVDETGAQVAAWSQAAQFVRLMQAATGIQSVDANATRGSAKLDLLEDQLRGRSRPDLVLCYYNNTAAAIARLCEKMKLKYAMLGAASTKLARRDTVDRFQRGEFDVLIGSIEVVAEGLTLTAADRVHFVERHWRPSRNEQAMRRVHRIGQSRPVTALNYYTAGTYDLNQRDSLAIKTDIQLRALTPAQILTLL